MNPNEKLAWSAPEYEEKERSQDWFWALGIIVTTASLAAIIFANYFFAVFLVLSGLLLAFFAVKKPDIVTYELNEGGLRIRTRLYPYEHIRSFWVETGAPRPADPPGVKRTPAFFIHSERMVMPVFSVPIEGEIAEDIRTIMRARDIPEVEMKEHPAEKIMEILGF
jgi:hypothetical protein